MHKLLIYSSLFPGPRRPGEGIFVAELVRSLRKRIEVEVVKPVIAHRHPGDLIRPERQYLDGGTTTVRAPLCLNVPKYFKGTDARLMAYFSRSAFAASVRWGAELVHAHFAYPDGAAAAILARTHRLPLVVTAHGSDIYFVAEDRRRREHIRRALLQADAVIVVARHLGEKVAELGVAEERIHHLPNGVDLGKFFAGDRLAARALIGLQSSGPVVLAVGAHHPVKAYDRLIRAMTHLDSDVRLLLVGDGPLRGELENLTRETALSDRVIFAGSVPHDQLAPYYQAADLLAISSHSEGWPTVIHEALACATPVAANRVGGIPQALSSSEVGLLIDGNEPEQLAEGISAALARSWDKTLLTATAQRHSWEEIGLRHIEIYERLLAAGE